MRILILDTMYGSFLDAHYAARPRLAQAPYAEQWRSLMDTSFGTADAYSHYLGELGHVAHEVVMNNEAAQNSWAAEHGLRRRLRSGHLRTRDWLLAVLRAQVEEFGPDVVYVQDLRALKNAQLEVLGRDALLAGQIATELPPWEQVEPYDIIFTSFPHYVSRLSERGLRAEYLRIAFDPRVLDRLGPPGVREGTVFVGGLPRQRYDRGNAILEDVADRIDLHVYGFGINGWPPEAALRRRYRGEAWGLDMYRALASARIALNRHGDVSGPFANNMRLYEATGVGTLLVTDAKDNLDELFVPGREVITYATAEELVDRVLYYLDHEDEQAQVAAAGQRRTLEEHTYPRRMRELAGALATLLAPEPASAQPVHT